MTLEIVTVPALKDNFVYLLNSRGYTAVVDPSEAEPVLRALVERGWKLDLVLNTHHHWDHSGGNLGLVEATGCAVAGALKDRESIPGITRELREGDEIRIGDVTGRVLETPGHTTGAISYYFADAHDGGGAVFTGDTLFSLGCGRLFEGTPAMMWASLSRLAALPESTRVYFGHEYTEANARFSLTVDSTNPELVDYSIRVSEARARGEISTPSTIAIERAANPFIRAGSVEAFADVRSRKDVFK